jgi:3-oxoacyl-[acyl-carrier protein] reductase
MPVPPSVPMLPLAPLAGRVAIVTGVSRRLGIAATIARQMLVDGASVLATGWHPHDADQPWGAEAGRAQATINFVTADLTDADRRFHYVESDLADPDVPQSLASLAIERFGALDIVVACHARSSSQSLRDVTVAELDASWAVNARGTVLLAKALQQYRDPSRPGGRLITFTSGQHLGPMPNELPYIVSKGAIQQMTASLSDDLIDDGITVNCVNPGPVDTGYASPEVHTQVAAMFPSKRWGQPADVASLVRFLVSDDGSWVTGQTLNSEGGFRR